jgi:hypothetical protein
MNINPNTPNEGVTYQLPCDNCGKSDSADTVFGLVQAMADHICEDAD